MATEQAILEDPEIGKFLEAGEDAAEAVRRAAKELADKHDAIPALRKLFPALKQKKLPIFFSYKDKDKKAAHKIVGLLSKYAPQGLDIMYFGGRQKEIAGREWRKWIRESIDKSNWFILLLPDPSDDWDWCLFETGLFDAKKLSGDRLICIHHPDTALPDPIGDYQAFAATHEKIESFLKILYLDAGAIPGMKPLNSRLDQKDISSLADDIVDAILPPRKGRFHEVFEPWLALKADDAAEFESKDDLDSATIEDANEEALKLFDFKLRPETLGKLRSDLPEGPGGDAWCEELFHVLRKVATGRQYDPIQAVFQTKLGKIYRPTLHGIDRHGDREGPIEKYHITFTEDVRALDSTGMSKNFYELVVLLRLAFRFRWEILEKFRERSLTEDDVDRIKNAFQRIETEWRSGGRGDLEADVTQRFPEGEIRDRVTALLQKSNSITNLERTGTLDVGLEKKDTKAVQKAIKQIVPLNQEFLEIVTDAFSTAVHKE